MPALRRLIEYGTGQRHQLLGRAGVTGTVGILGKCCHAVRRTSGLTVARRSRVDRQARWSVEVFSLVRPFWPRARVRLHS